MKKITKLTLANNELLSDSVLSNVTDVILTDCGTTYYVLDKNYYCHTNERVCIDPNKQHDDGSFKKGRCTTYVFSNKEQETQVKCYCYIV